MLSTFIKLPVVTKTFVLSIFEWPFYTGFTVTSILFCMFRVVIIWPDQPNSGAIGDGQLSHFARLDSYAGNQLKVCICNQTPC